MSWEKMEADHQQQWKEFEKLKYSSWQQLQKEEAAIMTSFGDKVDELPEGMAEKMDKRRQEWQKTWGENGSKAKELRDIQKIEWQIFKAGLKRKAIQRMNPKKEDKNKSRDYERDE